MPEPPFTFEPEPELLVSTVRRWFSADDRQVASAVRSGVDWTRALALARAHGITPLIHFGLAGTPGLPKYFVAALTADFQSCAAAVTLYAKELARISELFRRTGVRMLALKGPVLAIRAYGALALRPCRDLDLLVARHDLAKATALLQSEGYAVAADGPRSGKHLSLSREGYRVELHWSISSPAFSFSIPFGELWERREHVEVLGASVAAPNPEDVLIVIATHGASHRWLSLKWVCDIPALLRQCPAITWERVFRRATEFRAHRMLMIALGLARQLVGAPLAEPIEREQELDEVARGLVLEAWSRLGRVKDRNESEDVRASIACHIASRERLLDRIRVAGWFFRTRLRPTERERALAPLPGPLRILHWPIRAVRLLTLHSADASKLLLALFPGPERPRP